MLIALAARAAAAPAGDPIAEAVRYANILTGVDPDDEVARRAPDDPDDQRAGTSSDEEDDDQAGSLDDNDNDGDNEDADAEARADRWRTDRVGLRDLRGDDARLDPHDDDAGNGEDLDREDDPTRDAAETELAEHAGDLALLDDEPAGAVAVTSDDAGFAAPAAGAVERYEARMRRQRSWIVGRLDLGLAWRRRRSEPMHAMSYVSNEVWLLATWRR